MQNLNKLKETLPLNSEEVLGKLISNTLTISALDISIRNSIMDRRVLKNDNIISVVNNWDGLVKVEHHPDLNKEDIIFDTNSGKMEVCNDETNAYISLVLDDKPSNYCRILVTEDVLDLILTDREGKSYSYDYAIGKLTERQTRNN